MGYRVHTFSPGRTARCLSDRATVASYQMKTWQLRGDRPSHFRIREHSGRDDRWARREQQIVRPDGGILLTAQPPAGKVPGQGRFFRRAVSSVASATDLTTAMEMLGLRDFEGSRVRLRRQGQQRINPWAPRSRLKGSDQVRFGKRMKRKSPSSSHAALMARPLSFQSAKHPSQSHSRSHRGAGAGRRPGGTGGARTRLRRRRKFQSRGIARGRDVFEKRRRIDHQRARPATAQLRALDNRRLRHEPV